MLGKASGSCSNYSFCMIHLGLMPHKQLLNLNRQLIDLRSGDEVVFRQSADRVSPQLDCNVAVADQMQVGVMSLTFGNFGDPIEKLHRRDEVPDNPLASDSNAVVCQLPARQLSEDPLYFL